MSSPPESTNISKCSEPRRTRQQKVRSSPNSKLLNAAWPKAPTAPTRRSQIKAVNSGFGKSWNQWGQQTHAMEENSIEDMEVDIVADDEPTHTSKSMSKKFPAPITPPATKSKSLENNSPRMKYAGTNSPEDGRITMKARRNLSELSPSVQGGSPHRRLTRGSSKLEDSEMSPSKTQEMVEKMKIDSPKRKESQPLFIIIHANKIEVGDVKGPATSPIKVYAEKFMIKMEDESTKKEISFRVPCRKITSLEVSFLKKPFMIKFQATEIQYLSGIKSNKSKAVQPIETVILHLGHGESVPQEVQNDLKELFAVRLAELSLWPEKEENLAAEIEIKEDKSEEEDERKCTDMVANEISNCSRRAVKGSSKRNKVVKNISTGSKKEVTDTTKRNTDVTVENSNDSTTVLKVKTKRNIDGGGENSNSSNAVATEISRVDEVMEDNNEGDNKILRSSKRVQLASEREASGKEEPFTVPTVISVRKRTPYRSMSETGIHSSHKDDMNIAKFPRRCNFEMNDSLEEQVKTYSHEAAHYQSISAQQRMIIQSLEEDLQKRSRASGHEYDDIQIELDAANQALITKELDIENLNNELKLERDLVKGLEDRIDSMRRELVEKDILVAERNAALQVCNETIRELDATIGQHEETAEVVSIVSSSMEETRQNLMQMQVSKDSLTVELEEMRSSLIEKNREIETLLLQLNGVRNDLRNKDESLLHLRSDFISSQEELVRKNERIRYLNTQITTINEGGEEVAELRNQLSSTISQLDDVNSELAELKARSGQNEPNINEGQSSIPNDWVIGRGEISFQDGVLGVGAWGNVKKGSFRGTDVAVKQIHLLILSPHNRKLFEREMAIASRCRHPCLVQFIGATNDDGTPLFVMELLETDLRSLLSRQSLNDTECVQLGFDIIRALAYLHQSKPTPIIHRDISSSNILLYHGDNRWRAKLSDYGAANFMRLAMTRHPGAFLYSAPEASTVNQTTKLDVYSFGVLFCEMCIRELPIPENRQEQVESVTNIDRKTLIKNCLKIDISRRLDSTAVLHEFQRWTTRGK